MKKIIAIQIIITVLALAGWIQGIVKLCKCDFKAPYKAEILYGIGTLTATGAVIGWLNIDDAPTEATIIKNE